MSNDFFINRKIDMSTPEDISQGPPHSFYGSETEYEEDLKNNFVLFKNYLAEKMKRKDGE